MENMEPETRKPRCGMAWWENWCMGWADRVFLFVCWIIAHLKMDSRCRIKRVGTLFEIKWIRMWSLNYTFWDADLIESSVKTILYAKPNQPALSLCFSFLSWSFIDVKWICAELQMCWLPPSLAVSKRPDSIRGHWVFSPGMCLCSCCSQTCIVYHENAWKDAAIT